MRTEVAWLYRTLAARGLIVGSSGNVSARMPRAEAADGMVITPSGSDPDTLTEANLASITMEGVALDSATPSSEWALHAAVYRECPEAAFVVHTHSDAATALACLGSALPAFHYLVVQFGGTEVRCAPYVTFGTPALAAYTAEAIRGRTACLLANHGMVVCAENAKAASDRAMLLESLCRQYLLALSAGEPRLLTGREMTDAQERFKTYGPRRSEAAP